MKPRPGFTLLELLVALVLAGVVSLLVYGSVGAALDTQTRLSASRLELQSVRAMRATLHDALRNARPSRSYGDTAFLVESGRDDQGRPADRISFVTAGGMPPLTADADWRVMVQTSAGGLVLEATPVGIVGPQRVLVRVPGVSGLDVRVLELSRSGGWTEEWRFPSYVPRAIELTYWVDGVAVGSRERIALPLGGVR